MRIQPCCIATIVGLGLAATGCNPFCPTYKCIDPPGLEVDVTDADTGAALQQASVEAIIGGVATPMTLRCATTESPACHAWNVRGSAEVVVRATGYEDARFAVNVDEDMCGHAVSQHRDVALQKLGSARQAVTAEHPGAPSCGQDQVPDP